MDIKHNEGHVYIIRKQPIANGKMHIYIKSP